MNITTALKRLASAVAPRHAGHLPRNNPNLPQRLQAAATPDQHRSDPVERFVRTGRWP